MSIYKELSYEQDVDTISGIQFSIMSAEVSLFIASCIPT